MNIYTYDGSFEGLLTAVFEAYYRRDFPDRILSRVKLQQSLLDTYTYIPADAEKAYRVYTSIREKISSMSLKRIYYVFLSEDADAATLIYEYLVLGFKMKSRLDLHLSDQRVLKVHNLSRKVMGESHRMNGLLRFQAIYEDVYYAPMEPDYNIISVIAPHFKQRLGCQHWIIHDIKRGLAAIYDKNLLRYEETSFKGSFLKEYGETDYQRLWKGYFREIAIKDRINSGLQKKNMPARYWKYLAEMQPD
ncbi:putative DNA metabolism protein [Anaerobacterium chartisolvens]|uniref:Putative DNA metabolism protein n=1 Tax=Anaerobacterium chartisolvens TaxID=1297424 RepID=A0A369B5W6_9FIRM|nr:TIGR03915 family putative DNA repair protein [Anaerobacterium chartisolvens]RCX16831.1 putative DNA metabolism protein [Anaerobacterium chartisolvens]